jgi:sterol 24-C-methyltransferase
MTDSFDPNNQEHQKIKVRIKICLKHEKTNCFLISFQCNKVSLAQTEIEVGNGLPEIRLTRKCLEALKQAGFEVTASYSFFFFLFFQISFYYWHKFQLFDLFCTKVIWEKDLAEDSQVPWYFDMDTSRFTLSNFRITAAGRFITRNMVRFVSVKCFLLLQDLQEFILVQL